MKKEEARSFLIDISYKLGNMSVEYLTEKDGEKMREAIKVLEQEPKTVTLGDNVVYGTDGNLYKITVSSGKEYEQESCEDSIRRQAVNILVDELARAISDERCFMSRGRSTATIMQDILDLPSVNPQPCEDAISREAVLNIAKSSKSNWIDNSVLFKRVNELPPVNPQAKTGHWKYYQNDKGDWINKCSACGRDAGVGYQYPYCPNCGAKMKSEG